MWYEHLAQANSWWSITNRAYWWARQYREKYGDVTDICEVTPQNWVIYELFGQGLQNVTFRMAIMTPDGHVIDYPISADEFWSCPALPPNWAIPF